MRHLMPTSRQLRIRELFDSMSQINGEIRTVCECRYCHQLFGRRFIPYGLGSGLTVNPCHCMVTNNQHGNFATVEERTP